ncbi:MAG: DnaJ domain-containing protein, partial [Spirochaetales bacterium]|nr:DnaJ domain-containing protein [Spirochaetales bacterium]
SLHESIRRKYNVRGSSKAYAVLGLTENATEAEIKKAYRKLILEYHPDTIASKGMADEFKEYATKKFREIQEAYETICRERNIK